VSPIVPPLATALAALPDFRSPQGKRHPLLALLLLVCTAMLCGARGESAIADWAQNHDPIWRTRLGFTHHKGPSQSTIQRLFQGIDCAALERCRGAWAAQVVAHSPAAKDAPAFEAMAIDGKSLRTSRKCGAVDARLLSALSQRLGVVLGQVAIADTTDETGAVDDLLAALVLDGWVVTADAAFTETDGVQAIRDADGDYLLPVKGNQPTLLEDVTILFADDALHERTAEQTDLHSNRIERRVLTTSTALVGYSDWPGLAQALRVERRVTDKRTGETRHEVAYAITSLAPAAASAAHLLALWREHWCIENRSHWVRDVTFDEDRATVRAGRIPQALAAFRNAVIGLHRAFGATNIAAACRRHAADPARPLTALGLTWENE
jgi:predicted transposase YbfD/YdcC